MSEEWVDYDTFFDENGLLNHGGLLVPSKAAELLRQTFPAPAASYERSVIVEAAAAANSATLTAAWRRRYILEK